MTREEAITKFEKQLTSAMVVLDSGFGTRPGESDRLYRERKELAEIALSALRQQERFGEANKALTLDELRKMSGEPVWWWNKSAKTVCTICVWDRFMNEPMFANYDWQSEDTLQLSKYKWLKKCGYKPYRQKPEEGTV